MGNKTATIEASTKDTSRAEFALLERDPISYKWIWMMDYCKKCGISPAQVWAWQRADQAYIATHRK